MSEDRLAELRQEEENLRSFLSKAKSHRQRWTDELKEREAELEEAILQDQGVYRKTNKVQAAATAAETWARKVGETQGRLEEVKDELREYEFAEAQEKAREARKEARETLAELEDELIETILRLYEKGWRAQRDANRAASQANSLARKVGAQTELRTTRMNGLSADEYVRGILRAAIREGKLS